MDQEYAKVDRLFRRLRPQRQRLDPNVSAVVIGIRYNRDKHLILCIVCREVVGR